MTDRKRNLLMGAAAVALLGGGLTAGALLFGGDGSHVGETPEEHAAELGSSAAAAAGDEHDEHREVEDGHAEGEGEAHAEGLIEIDPAEIESAGITLVEVSPGSLASEIIAQATVAAAPDGEAILTARASGAVTSLRKRLGDPVRRGETVALVLSSEAAALSAARTSAASRLDLAETTFEREKKLFESRITSRQEFEAAEAELSQARAEFQRSEAAARAARVTADGQSVVIASPIDGRVTAVTESAKLGAYVAPETVLFRIADPTKVQVEAAVPASDALRISAGDAATVEGPAGQGISANVRSVTPALDVESRTATVVLALTGPATGVQPGQSVRVIIRPRSAAPPAEGRLVLPVEAVQSVEGQDVVFVRTDSGFSATPVRVGPSSGGRVEILDGLRPGQVVAERKAFVLKAELGKGEAEHDH
jgi:membrane fusion protein, heavy metal efflux system